MTVEPHRAGDHLHVLAGSEPDPRPAVALEQSQHRELVIEPPTPAAGYDDAAATELCQRCQSQFGVGQRLVGGRAPDAGRRQRGEFPAVGYRVEVAYHQIRLQAQLQCQIESAVCRHHPADAAEVGCHDLARRPLSTQEQQSGR